MLYHTAPSQPAFLVRGNRAIARPMQPALSSDTPGIQDLNPGYNSDQ